MPAIACYNGNMSMMKIEEYAKQVGKDKADVYRAVREGRLKVTRGPGDNSHHAMLINSSQLWPRQRQDQTRTVIPGQIGQLSVKPAARVPVQSQKSSAKPIAQPPVELVAGAAGQADKADDKTSGNGWWEL
ncbi:hypothetical protein LCGC14_3112380, partial [marine sediment metagenome]